MGNFIQACFLALTKTYTYLSPDLWTPTQFTIHPYQEHTDFLASPDVRQGKGFRKEEEKTEA
jgi:small subunit ribosomal protein S2e